MVSASMIAMLTGCNSGTENVVAVSGTLTFEGTPVSDVRLVFSPKDGRPSIATTDADGRFRPWYKDKQYGVQAGMVSITFEKSDSTDLLLGKRAAKGASANALLKHFGHGTTVTQIEISGPTDDLVIALNKP